MSLLKEFSTYQPAPSLAAGDAQLALKKADGTNAGVNDTDVKNDIRFNMMRNILNREEGDVTSSDVQNYLERSQEINDEVDTVAFGIETDDDDTIKIYVNAEQADQFEAEMSKLLGLDGDAEAAINTLAQTFDIVDVVWPNDPEGDDEENEDGEPEINIDDELGFDQEESSEEENTESSSEDNEDEGDEGDEPEKSPEDQEEDFEDGEPKPKKDDEESDEEESDENSEEPETETDDEADEEEFELDDEGEPIPEVDEDGEPVLDKDGNPVMKRKKKAKAKDQSTGDKDMKTEGLKLNGLAKLVESKRKVEVLNKAEDKEDLQLTLDDKAEGADEVTYKGKKYKRSGPKNSTSNAGKWKLVKESYQPEEGSLGSKFLDRVVVSEAAGEEMEMSDTVLKGLRNRLKRPYEKKAVELMSLAGVLGRYVDDVEGLGDGIRAGADALRRGGRVQRAFNAFYDGMKNLSSGGMVAEAKKGTMTLKRLVSVLSQFGLPASAGEENGALSTALRRTANKIDKTPETESALVDLARALGLSSAEVNESQLDEAFPEANDAFIEAAINMMTALGLPQANLDYRGTQTFQALRKRKMALGNAPALANRINKLAELIKAAERPGAVQEGGSASSTGNFRLDEAFGELEALVASQRRTHNIAEPAYGPAMIAHFQGNPKHKDTKLIIGVDEEHDDEPLQVSIVSPWDKTPIEQRNFENTKEGYTDALKYANLMRSAPLDKTDKKTQTPKGWQD